MTKAEKIEMTKNNIEVAIEDYFRHTNNDEVQDDISDRFVDNLAKDAVEAKEDLRNMLRKSPAWNEELDCLIINGNRTHEPEEERIWDLGLKILAPAMREAREADDKEKEEHIRIALHYFAYKEDYEATSVEAIKALAPKAYAPNKKPSRIFKALCDALGLVDNSAGSDFQKLYAKFADELSAKKIDFKLFVSVNPAHFLTMSNPKYDKRGSTLTSCHSFNNTEYEYNNGCTGYARDSVTMIAFTVADPSDPETLNNRKTTRQLFMYEPNNGVLLQSRMYNTSGGTTGAQAESKVYRELIQREIAECEGQPNLWRTADYIGNKWEISIRTGSGFGGYADWVYSNFDPKISIRQDKEATGDFGAFSVGVRGLCISCGNETWTDDGLYCEDCNPNSNQEYCEECGCYHDEDDMTTVYDARGNQIRVCSDCLEESYRYCSICEEYHHVDVIHYVSEESDDVCEECLDRYFEYCEDCEEYHRKENMNDAYYRGNEVRVCDDCLDNYVCCNECGEYHHEDDVTRVYDADGNEVWVCDDCLDDYEECEECGEYHHVDTIKDGLCEDCYEKAHEDDDNNEEVA